MHVNSLIKAGLLGFAIAITGVATASAQTGVLSVMRGSTSGSITVAVNRAIVVESDVPFAEISVANPAIADIASLSDRTIYVLGKAAGATTMTLLDPNGQLIANVDLRVQPDLTEFKERLQEILPGEQIEVRTANDGIVLSGRVSGARKVARALELAERYAPGRVTNLMMVGGSQQVMLRVRFAEMRRSVAKELGSFLGGSAGGVVPADTGSFTAGTNGGGQLSVQLGFGGVAIDLMMQALETRGVVRTLAEPNLVAISGQDASFLAGGEYPTPAADGAIEYRPFGVQLLFKPTVIDGDLINLEIGTVVSSLDTSNALVLNGDTILGFSTRSANTTVEIRDGQSFAIAGLLQDDFRDVSNQVPWLGDVPVLGALFRSAEYRREQTELVIIVTAHLVVPTSAEALALPTDRMRIPSEEELFLFGRVEGRATSSGSDVGGLTGTTGYVLE
ncbi:MAG: type II and III secretion system protein family protein [Paracoccaceae bacterium]